jgi:hypothetical protein
MSPFEALAARLGERVATLPRRAQVLFFACASQVLLPAFTQWSERVGGAPERRQLLEDAIGAARAFAMTERHDVDLDGLLETMESAAPEQPPDPHGFTAAQDAWICGDVALRVARGKFEPRDGIWYVLEPSFHATSERLFGVADVGSEREDEGEAGALRDPILADAIAGVERALEHLDGVVEPTEWHAAEVRRELEKLTG